MLGWLATERGRATNTIYAYRRDLAAYASGWAPTARSCTVEPPTLVDFVAARRATGAAPSTVARQLAAVRTLHRYLLTEGDSRRACSPADTRQVKRWLEERGEGQGRVISLTKRWKKNDLRAKAPKYR